MYNPFIKNKTRRLYKKNPREKVFRNLKEIHSVLVFFDTRNFDDAVAFVKQLVHMGKSPEAYAYQSQRDNNNDYLKTAYTIITEKDASKWFGRHLNDISKKLTSNHYDALFDLSLDRNIPLEYLTLIANADLKIGCNKGEPSPYDMAINLPDPPMPSEPEEEANPAAEAAAESKQLINLTEQIIHYLKTIKS